MALRDPLSLDGLDQIPDPLVSPGAARGVASAVPPAVMPTEASPTRVERRRRAILAAALGAAWLGAAVVRLGVRADIGAPAVAAPLAAWALTVAMGLVLVLRPGPRGLPVGVRVVQHALWVVPAIYVIVATLAAQPVGEPGWAAASTCLVVAGLMALGPLAAAALIFARAFPSASLWRGAAVGALAGLSGAIGIHAHCPYQSWGHLLMAHGPVIVVGAILGGLFGRTRGRS